MLLSEVKELPLRYQPTVGTKTRKYDGNLQDFKADITATHGVVKKVIDGETKVQYFLTKQKVIAARWDALQSQGLVYFK